MSFIASQRELSNASSRARSCSVLVEMDGVQRHGFDGSYTQERPLAPKLAPCFDPGWACTRSDSHASVASSLPQLQPHFRRLRWSSTSAWPRSLPSQSRSARSCPAANSLLYVQLSFSPRLVALSPRALLILCIPHLPHSATLGTQNGSRTTTFRTACPVMERVGPISP